MFLNLFDDGEPEAGWDTRHARTGGAQYSLFGVDLDFQLATKVDGELGTGTVVWDSGEALAEFLMSSDGGYGVAGLLGKRVLEVGAGVGGLPGIAALLGGAAHVTLTDKAQLLPLLERNVVHALALHQQQLLVTAKTAPVTITSDTDNNPIIAAGGEREVSLLQRSRYSVEVLNWAEAECFMSENRPPFDLILVADCTFDAKSDATLLSMLPRLCGPSTEILLLHNFRCPMVHKRLLQLFQQFFAWSEIPRCELGDRWKSVAFEYLHLYKLRILPPYERLPPL